ncbi:hypothetical protein EXU57_01225 [Segetibacter sp. 3557_3]|uniref:hypothetical protein n=1 Tax=Segetibacter sp. 3557_3 TaxID=2547429 RepID=UPI001058556A|nr:hypothetical protein [Segetibacter sp. 3557_3]TDH28725.1 hypothetical protein EXU57_01225 [Segetibacter sp. 3557_3]
MRRITLTLLCVLFIVGLKAQAVTFLSLGFSVAQKDMNGNVTRVKERMLQQMHIHFDLDQKRILFRSTGMFSTDTFHVKKTISISGDMKSPSFEKDSTTMVFSGVDDSGQNCTVRLKVRRDEYKTRGEELQIEYLQHTESYSLQALRQRSIYNKTNFGSE